MTNMRELVEALRGRVCTGGAHCSRTGLEHEKWEPKVHKGEVIGYTTGGEAEYPREMCAALARGMLACWAGNVSLHGCAFVATEIFSGPNAPLTAALEAELDGWAGLLAGASP